MGRAAEARLDELVALHGLDASARARLAALLAGLAADEHAPSPIREPERAVDVHVADSLAGLAAPELRSAAAVADLGAGVGFPGLALAAARPELEVTAVESVGRRGEWLRSLAASAGVANVRVVVARAEEWDARDCELVVARALAALPVLVEYAAPLLREGGALVAWKARPEPAEVEDGIAAASLLGLEPLDPIPVEPYAEGGRRLLVRYRKIAPTPAGYPRRPGMAAKRPLGTRSLR